MSFRTMLKIVWAFNLAAAALAAYLRFWWRP